MNGTLLPGTVLASLFLASSLHAATAPEPVPPATANLPVTAKVRTGQAPNFFDTVPEWGTLPEGMTHGPSQGGIVVDRAGYVYVSNDVRGIDVFSPSGLYLRTIGRSAAGTFSLTIHEEGGIEYLYGAHLRGLRAFKMTLEGKTVLRLPFPAASGLYSKGGREFRPTSVAVTPDGAIFVVDGGELSLVHKFDAKGEYLLTFGGAGTQPGELRRPHGLTVDTRYDPPLLLVCDRENRRLQHFDLEGKFVRIVAKWLGRPSSAAIYGEFVAIAEREGRVTVLDGENKVATRLGANPTRTIPSRARVPKEAWRAGVFIAPHGIAWDAHGSLYVQEWSATGRLTKLELADP